MLSLLAAYSSYLMILAGLSLLPTPGGEKTSPRRFPKLRPNLWILSLVIAVLALDFVAVSWAMSGPVFGPSRARICMLDAAVVLVPLLAGVFFELTLWDFWCLACIVGVAAAISFPSVSLP